MLQCVVSLFTSLMDESFLLAACQFMLPQNARHSPFNAEATNIGREKKTTTDDISAGRPTVGPRFGSGGRIDPNIDGTYNPSIGMKSMLMWKDHYFSLSCKDSGLRRDCPVPPALLCCYCPTVTWLSDQGERGGRKFLTNTPSKNIYREKQGSSCHSFYFPCLFQSVTLVFVAVCDNNTKVSFGHISLFQRLLPLCQSGDRRRI